MINENKELVIKPYQQECLEKIDNIERGSYLVSMATGLGKTFIFTHIKRKGKVLILSHRDELVSQPKQYYTDCTFGVEKGKIISNGEDVVSASVQSFKNRLNKFDKNYFDTIITDEAHHAAADTYKKIYEYFQYRLHIGFTATPNRGDKLRLDDVFVNIIFQRDLKWGIENGYLSNIECKRVKVSFDTSGIKSDKDDFILKDLQQAVDIESANKEIADIYLKISKGQTLIFAASVEHAEKIARNIPGAVAVTAKTKNRGSILEEFRNKKIKCIVNYMIFTEGTDLPMIETIIIARPTKDQSLYTQMVGRGLRLYEGKENLLLIDCVGVTEDFNICTAPSLIGLDLINVPKNKLSNIEGKLTELENKIKQQEKNPTAWLLNIKSVDTLEKQLKVDFCNIRWDMAPSGYLFFEFNNRDRIGIGNRDDNGRIIGIQNQLGKTRVLFYKKSTGKDYKFSAEMTLQEALLKAAEFFVKHYKNEEFKWNIERYKKWECFKATKEQLDFIKKLYSREELEGVELNSLTKGQASFLIDKKGPHSNNNETKYADINQNKDKKSQQKRNITKREIKPETSKAKSKISQNSKANKEKKFYAIRAGWQSGIIVDSWDECKKYVDGYSNEDYKSFKTKKEAEKYLS